MKTLSKTHRAAVVAILAAGTVLISLLGRTEAQQPYVGEVMTFAGTFCPQGYLSAQGQLLWIAENDTLFVVIGTTFGGDGLVTFELPNLVGATVLGTGQGGVLPNITLGQTGGTTTTVTVQIAIAKSVEVPATQSPFVSLTQCVSLFGIFPSQ